MAMSVFVAFCLFLALEAGRALGWTHVTEASFKKGLRSNEYTLVAFVDPSQDASKTLEAEWTSIQETERDHNVICLDCDTKRKLCDEFDVVSYPAIRLYHQDGRMDRYRGPRKASAIVPFLRRALRPTVSTLDEKNITSFLAVDDVVLVAHVEPGDDSLAARFVALAGQLRDRYSFAFGPPAEQQSAIGCFNNQDNEQHSSSEFATIESLERFVTVCTRPVIVELTRRNEMENLSLGKSLVHYFVSTEDQREAYLKEMRPLAKKYREYLQFTTIDTNEYPEMVEALGLSRGSTNALSVLNPQNGDVFPYTGGQKITAAVVEAFLIDIINGKVQAFGKGGQHATSGTDRVQHEEL